MTQRVADAGSHYSHRRPAMVMATAALPMVCDGILANVGRAVNTRLGSIPYRRRAS